ncbi:MAG: S41 family peptidase [Bacteroidota bacterium]|nr:S41 family peptidase [Bacteroidota bacterium]
MLKDIKILILSFVALFFIAFQSANDYFEISKNIEIFGAVYKTVNRDYVDEPKPGELMKVGIDAMLASLDPYTNYYTESQAEDAMIMRSGEYGGIGSRSIKREDYIYISDIFKGLAADKAGLKIGDKIVEINGKNFKGKSSDEVGNALKGAPNTKANLVVERNGQMVNIEINREEIKLKNVTYFGLADSETGYIRLDHFMMGAGQEVKDALIKLKAQGIKQVILDLRDNGGGLLHEAVNIVNVFIGSGEMVVYSDGRVMDAKKTYKTLDPATDANIPLVVLVNGRSASASEIVSGAIQDFDRGVVIGQKTFGKGLVQNVKPLIYRTQMKVTIAKYYIPSGRCIQELDYSNKGKDGKATILADSLKKKFKTRNGREVLDGGGVMPDIAMPVQKTSSIVQLLDRSYLIFDFASKYHAEHAQIGDMKNFMLTDKDYEDFKAYVKTTQFSQKNETETQLQKLIETAEKAEYASSLKDDFEKMKNTINTLKLQEMDQHKTEILQALRLEISRRYYYEEALFLNSFQNDPVVLKSFDIFKNKTDYQTLLGKK